MEKKRVYIADIPSLQKIISAPINTKIDMPKVNCKKVSVTAGQIKQRYALLYNQWREMKGTGIALKALMAEIGLLGRMANHLCKQGDTNIVVFGHSHD